MLQNLFQKILKEFIFLLVVYQTANYPTLPLALEGLRQGRGKTLSLYFKNSCTRSQMHRVGVGLPPRMSVGSRLPEPEASSISGR